MLGVDGREMWRYDVAENIPKLSSDGILDYARVSLDDFVVDSIVLAAVDVHTASLADDEQSCCERYVSVAEQGGLKDIDYIYSVFQKAVHEMIRNVRVEYQNAKDGRSAVQQGSVHTYRDCADFVICLGNGDVEVCTPRNSIFFYNYHDVLTKVCRSPILRDVVPGMITAEAGAQGVGNYFIVGGSDDNVKAWIESRTYERFKGILYEEIPSMLATVCEFYDTYKSCRVYLSEGRTLHFEVHL